MNKTKIIFDILKILKHKYDNDPSGRMLFSGLVKEVNLVYMASLLL
jgi:hypothetical protein